MSGSRLEGHAADQLILKIAQGDMSALESLYSAMYGEIFAYLYSMLGGDRQSAEDLAQDTFIRVYKYAPKFAAEGHGRAWVYRIAGRLALTHLGKNAVITLELDDRLPDGTDVEGCAVRAGDIASAMAAISPEERQVVSMHAVAGMTLGEIAEVLGQPIGTVKWRHAQAIKKLRALLGEDY